MGANPAMSLLEQVNHLPTVPRVVRELIAEFDRPEAEVERVSRLIGSDPVLATKLLRLANSAYYRRAGAVSRLPDALIFVGLHAARNLVLATGLAASPRFPADFPTARFWRFSLHTAVAARELARRAQDDADTAFAAGLVRAIGKPLTAGVIGAPLREVDRVCSFFDEARVDAERARLGFNYVEVSAAVAERWHFPARMVSALRQSQAWPPPGRTEAARLGAVLALAARMAAEHEAGRPGAMAPLPESARGRLALAGLPPQALQELPPLPALAAGLEALGG